jgi:hypothetical protein
MATAEFPRDAVAPSDSLAGSGQRLSHNLQKVAARRNALRMRQAIVRALIPAVALAAGGTLAYRFYFIDSAWWMPVALIVAALAIGYRNGRLQQRGIFDAAVEADSHLHLEDRLSSALAFSQPQSVQRAQKVATPQDWKGRLSAMLFPRVQYRTAGAATTTALVPSLVEEAATRSDSLDPKVLYPTRFDRPLQVLLGLSLLWAVFTWMPDNTYFLTPEQKQLTATLKAEGIKLQAIAKEVRRKEEQTPKTEATRKLAKRLDELGQKLQKGRITKRGALLGMGELKRDLEKAVRNDRQGSSPDMARMQEALRNTEFATPEAQQMQQDFGNGEVEKAAQQLERLADKLDKGQMSQQEREQAANDLEKLAKTLKEQGGAQNDAAAQQLKQAAKALREGGKNGQQNGQQPGQQQGQQNQQGKGQGQAQSQQGQSQSGQQQGQKQQGQQSGSGSQSQQGQQQGQGQGNQSGADALRNMARGMRQNGSQMGNSQSLRDMLNKIREAENQTGSNSGQQSGQGQKQGQNCTGPGCQGSDKPDSALTPGKDLMPTDPTQGGKGGAGLGRRDHIQTQQGKGGGVSDQRAQRTGDKRRWNDVWSDRLPQTRQKLDRITGKMGSDGDVEQLPTQSDAKNGPVKTPYYEVYESYKKDAEDAISKESVPPAYKQPVKEYFESLKP